MSEDKLQTKAGNNGSKYVKVVLVVVMAFLLFGGPYAAYTLINILHASYVISTIGSFAMIIAGLVLMWYLIKKKIIV
jgi:hypothetical protein